MASACSFSHGPASEPAFANGERDAELLCVCGFPKREHALGYSRSRCDFTPVGAAFASIAAQESLVASMAARGARDARVRDAVARIAEARRVVATMTPGPYTLVPRFAPVGPEDPSSLLGRGHSLFVGKFDHRRDAHAFAALPSLVMQLAADLEKAIDDANNARCAANLWQHLATDTVNAAKQARARQAIDDLAAHSQAIGWPDAMMPRDSQPARLAGEP